MATITSILNRIALMRRKTGKFAIRRDEFFSTLEDIVNKVDEVNSNVNSVAKSLIWQAPVPNFAALAATYPNPERGWASLVQSEGIIYAYNGSEWKSTGLTAFPDDVALKGGSKKTLKDMEDGLVQLDLSKLDKKQVRDRGFYLIDAWGNIGLKLSEDGVFDVPSLSPRLMQMIKEYVGVENVWMKPRFFADVYMIPCYGQSLSINVGAGVSTFSYVEELSHNVNLQKANIQDMCAGTAEMFGILSSLYGIDLPKNFKIIHCLGGAGGISVAGLSKGTSYYNNVINSIRTAKQNCDAAGLTLNVPCFTWTQGEEDMRAGGNPAAYGIGNFNPFTYKNRLKKLIDDFNADIKAITGQANDVLCISYQVASHTSYYRYPRIAMQQLDLANEDERMFLAKTMYDIPYIEEGNHMVHAPARTYRNIGNFYGIMAFKTCVMGLKPKPLQPIYHSVSGRIVNIKFNVPAKPLVLDTITVPQLPDNNFGFNIYNISEQSGANGSITKSQTAITNVELSGDDTVVLTLNRAPKPGDTLTYGVNGDYWQNIAGTGQILTGGEGVNNKTKSGNVLGGSRGCLRDSQRIKNKNSGNAFQCLYNFCVIFEIKL